MKLTSLSPHASASAALAPADARQQLHDIRNQLVHPTNGSIKSGYLRLSPRGTLNVGGWLTKGSHSQATQSIRALVHQAYAGQLNSPGKLAQIDAALDRYLQKSGNAIGSRTFVRIIDELERKMLPDDLQNSRRNASLDELAASHLKPDAYEYMLSGPEVRAMRGSSPISETALAQFEKLAVHTPKVVMEHFKSLMFPSLSSLNPVGAVQGPDAPRTFAMGDADGSMGRMVLHAMASAVAQLPDQALADLGSVLKAEYSCRGDLVRFQSSQEVSQALDRIADALTVHPRVQGQGEPACIFLGDILSDRFTNNQQAMGRMIYKLSGRDAAGPHDQATQTGVRFIAGNHDTFALQDIAVFGDKNPSWGGNALKSLSEKEHRALLTSCFQAAEYSAGVLYTHNGVSRDPGGGYRTGLNHWVKSKGSVGHAGKAQLRPMRVQADSAAELAQKMNHAFWQHLSQGRGMLELIATDFRPADEEMTAEALKFNQGPPLRQVHGHNGSQNEDAAGVTNLNARNANSEFAPTGRVIEYAPVQPDAVALPQAQGFA